MAPAVIFDLDDTLLDTSALREARDRRDLAAILAQLTSVKPFAVAAGEPAVAELPKAAKRRGYATGLLTHSPRPYAEALVAEHGLRVDEMVTGSDGFPAKPDPSGLLALCKSLGVEPSDAVYVGDAVGDFGAAADAGMASIGVSWAAETPLSWRHGWPDYAFDRPSRLLEFFDGAETLGPLGEQLAAGEDFEMHWGSILRLGSSAYGLGRYFPTGDRRHAHHDLSHLIVGAKDEEETRDEMAAIFRAIGGRLKNPPALIASVPPSPEKEDRFGSAREALASSSGAEDGQGLLVQRYDAPDYLGTARAGRAELVADRFELSRDLDGESIVLIDDVFTSGSQSAACREVLLAGGAGAVAIFVASVTQDSLPDPCPSCGDLGGRVKVRRRHRDGVRFYACSRYPNCEWTASI